MVAGVLQSVRNGRVLVARGPDEWTDASNCRRAASVHIIPTRFDGPVGIGTPPTKKYVLTEKQYICKV